MDKNESEESKGNKIKEKVEIRKATINDAEEIIKFTKKVSDETDFLSAGSEERNITLEQEIDFIEKMHNSTTDTMFVAIYNESIIASCGIHGYTKKRIKHRVGFGISVLREYWGFGIAGRLIEKIIEYSKNIGIKKIELEVRADNERAIKLYEKYGFEKEGEIRNYFYLNGIYYNCYLMGLLL